MDRADYHRRHFLAGLGIVEKCNPRAPSLQDSKHSRVWLGITKSRVVDIEHVFDYDGYPMFARLV